MPVVWAGYGGLAYDALRQVVGEVKGDDPLALVSVLVPANLCGVVCPAVFSPVASGGGLVLRVCRC